MVVDDLGYDDYGFVSQLSEDELRAVAAGAGMLPGHTDTFVSRFAEAATLPVAAS